MSQINRLPSSTAASTEATTKSQRLCPRASNEEDGDPQERNSFVRI